MRKVDEGTRPEGELRLPGEGALATGDEERAIALYCRGARPDEIAATLAIPPEELTSVLRRWQRRLQEERRADDKYQSVLAVESLRAISAAAWAAFEREREIERATLNGELDHVKRRVTRAAPAPRGKSAAEETLLEEFERPRLSNQGPRYLSVALTAQREMARLLGLYDEAGKDREPVEILITRNPPWPEPDASDWPADEEISSASAEPAGGGEISTDPAAPASAELESTSGRNGEMIPESFLPGRVDRESEFVAGLTGTCGPNAAAMAERWADQSQLNTLDVYHRMRAANRCDPNGAATMAALADDARAAGYTVDLLPYREPMPEADWRAFFERYAGRQAIVYETAYGQALRDAITGFGENARDLHYHFVMIAGWHPGGQSARAGRNLPPGWWCADGANFAGGNALQFYPDDVVVASRPCAAMAIAPRVVAPTGGGPTHVPVGWHDDGQTLTAPNGHRVVLGFREYVLNQPSWAPDNVPLEEERHVAETQPGNPAQGAGQRQVFLRLALEWTQAGGVRASELGPQLLALEAALDALRGRVTAAEAQLQSAVNQPE